MRESNKRKTSIKEASPKEPHSKKIHKLVKGAYDLSLGISVVVAILIGVGIGLGLRKILGWEWLLWLGVFWGVGAGILNIYKAYKRAKKELHDMAGDIKYVYQQERDKTEGHKDRKRGVHAMEERAANDGEMKRGQAKEGVARRDGIDV